MCKGLTKGSEMCKHQGGTVGSSDLWKRGEGDQGHLHVRKKWRMKGGCGGTCDPRQERNLALLLIYQNAIFPNPFKKAFLSPQLAFQEPQL